MHIDEARQHKAAGQIVDVGAHGCMVTGGGKHGANEGAIDFDDAIGLRDAADHVDDRDVIEDQQREGKHFFRVADRTAADVLVFTLAVQDSRNH